nr:flagellar motor switch protein FliM [Thioalkalivibrio sp.]
MAPSELLSQEEIDALLHGVDSGDVDTDTDLQAKDGIARDYDFTSKDRIVRGRMPTLDMVNERFARFLRVSLFRLMRRSAEITLRGVKMSKFSEYVHSLSVPTSLSTVKVRPLRGTALFVLDASLVSILVDNFFGGDGRYHAKIEDREFTPTELRVIRVTLDQVFVDLKKAWTPVMELDFEYVSSEVNPEFTSIVSPSEVVMVSSFHIDLDGGGGEFHVTMPYFMIEPIRELLDAGIQSDRPEADERWIRSLREELKVAEVEASSVLAETTLSLAQVVKLKAGDIIPLELPKLVLLRAEGIPVARGKFGISEGRNAIQVTERVSRPN